MNSHHRRLAFLVLGAPTRQLSSQSRHAISAGVLGASTYSISTSLYLHLSARNCAGSDRTRWTTIVRRSLATTTEQRKQQAQQVSQEIQKHPSEEASSSNCTTPSTSRGLYSIRELQTPSDFVKLAGVAIRQCDTLRQEVVTIQSSMMTTTMSSTSGATTCTTPSTHQVVMAKQLLFLLDRISQMVCNVIDAAELARSTHIDPLWRASADRAFGILSDYITQLNSDPTLYEALRSVSTTPTPTTTTTATPFGTSITMPVLTQEEKRFATLLQAEFERDGIHLPDQQRENVRQIQNQLTELETIFTRNIVTSKSDFFVYAKEVEAVIPSHVLQSFGITTDHYEPLDHHHQQRMVQLSNNIPQILQTLTKYSSSSQLRKQVYMETMTAVPENLSILEALIAKRYELAKLLGFHSYADRCLRDRMVQSPQRVQEFLMRLQTRIQPSFQKEMGLLSHAKQQLEGNGIIEPWDISFYVGLLKNQGGHYQGDQYDDLNMISEYLTLQNCLDGMILLVDRLFGIRMMEQSITDNAERWDVMSAKNNNRKDMNNSITRSNHTQIRRFVFEDNKGRPLGTLYLDLFPREGKYTHAAHFTVRCGCLASNDGVDYNDNNYTVDNHYNLSRYQLPIVALVCNLSGSSMDAPLAHGEVETLFHEFGHALHSMLSRTKFQHMSGTRAAMDYVETPSHLIENFVWDTQFLQAMGKHHQHGGPIPDKLITALQKSRYEFAAIEQQNQVLYALFDQKLFGITQQPHQSSTQIFAGLHHELGIPYADGTHWHSRFGHLVSYGAGYYGYLYAQVFARDIWKTLFDRDSLNRSAGNRLWQHLLIHGGAKDPTHMLHDLLGRPPQVDYYA